jgi:hypothetical protein
VRDRRLTSISKARTLREIGDFWDGHDATDFEDGTYPVEFDVDVQTRRHYVAVDPDLLERLRREAHARGVSAESLINLWLQEHLTHQQA